MALLPSIDLEIPKKLKDREYRQNFFIAEASALIAKQLIALRKARGLSQAELAKEIGTTQSGVSRVESADYSKWSFNTLRKISEVLDARLRVVIEPTEAVIQEYAEGSGEEAQNPSGLTAAMNSDFHEAYLRQIASIQSSTSNKWNTEYGTQITGTKQGNLLDDDANTGRTALHS